MPDDNTWRDRVLAEYEDLRIKIERLTAGLQNPGMNIPSRQRNLLRAQRRVMESYLIILKLRLDE